MRCALSLIVLPAVLLFAGCDGGPPPDQRTPAPAASGDGAGGETATTADDSIGPGADSPTAGGADSEPTEGVDAATLALGVQAYTQGSCVMCHGANGGGVPRFGPDLTDDTWVHGDGSVASIRELLVSGIEKGDFVDTQYPMAMPPVTNLITDESKIDALAKYIWSLSNESGE